MLSLYNNISISPLLGTVSDELMLQAPKGSTLSNIYKYMLANKTDSVVLSYDQGIRELLKTDGKPTAFIGSRDSFFGTEGLVALNLNHPAKFSTAPALPLGSEFR